MSNKRKKPNSIQNKTLKRSRIILNDFGFDFTHTTNNTTISVKEFTKPYFDTRHFEIRFEPPLSKKDALEANIRMIYMPTKTCDIRFYVATSESNRITVLDPKHKYITYYTHTVQIQSKKGIIPLLYVTIQNTQLNGDSDALPDYKLVYTNILHSRYEPLPFFPPDPDIELAIKGGIDSRLVPQNIRMNFKAVNGQTITSNTVVELLAYFGVPVPGTPDAKEYNFTRKKESKDGWKGVNMRFGSLRERDVAIYLLESNPQLTVKQCGFYPHDTEDDWGSMPDLMLYDDSLTVDKIPQQLHHHINLMNNDNKDFYKYGTAEIKSSRFHDTFKEYHIPQCIWHMMCCNTLWNDLIVYCEKKALDPETRNWVKQKICKRIRLFRSEDLETQLIDVIRTASQFKQLNQPQQYLEYIYNDPQVLKLKKEFENIAKGANMQAVDISDTINDTVLEQILLFREEDNLEDDYYNVSLHPAIDRIEQRQADIFRLYQEPEQTHYKQLVQQIAEQIADYTLLMK